MKIEFDAENNFEAAYNVAGIDCSVFVEDGRVTIYLHNPLASEEENSRCEVKVCEGDCGDCPFGYDEDEGLLLEDAESTGFMQLEGEDEHDSEYAEVSTATTLDMQNEDGEFELEVEETEDEEGESDVLDEGLTEDPNYALAKKLLEVDTDGTIAKFITSVLENKNVRKLSENTDAIIEKLLSSLNKLLGGLD